MLGLLVGLIVLALFLYLLFWVLGQIPLPQPIRVVVLVLAALIAIYALFSYFPLGGLGLHRGC